MAGEGFQARPDRCEDSMRMHIANGSANLFDCRFCAGMLGV